MKTTRMLVLGGAAAGLLFVSGCSTTVKTAPGVYLGPLEFEGLKRSEYVILGDVTGNAQANRFLWFGKPSAIGVRGLGEGGEAKKMQSLLGRTVENAAVYDALAKSPEADFILPMIQTTEKSGFYPFSWSESATVKGKAIKIKADENIQR